MAIEIRSLFTKNGDFRVYICNVVKPIIDYPFGNGLYHLFMVIWGMAYYCFNHITGNM